MPPTNDAPINKPITLPGPVSFSCEVEVFVVAGVEVGPEADGDGDFTDDLLGVDGVTVL
jgi:hypothetical protein